MSSLPSIFVAHGAPLLALDPVKGADFRAWADGLPAPTAILAVSAHWESKGPLRIGTTTPRPLLYDFYGFPEALYHINYPAPGAPALADRVAALSAGHMEVVREPDRPLDHGVWVPLVHMYPAADIPLLQLSLPRDRSPRELFELGRRLAPLREEGVLVMASGVLTHNLRDIDLGDRGQPADWAVAFDDWLVDALRRRDLEALFDWRERAPHARHAHPTDEHFTPLFIALGGAGEDAAVSFPIAGFEYRNLSRRCVTFR